MGTPTVYDWTKTSNFDCYSTLDCVYNEIKFTTAQHVSVTPSYDDKNSKKTTKYSEYIGWGKMVTVPTKNQNTVQRQFVHYVKSFIRGIFLKSLWKVTLVVQYLKMSLYREWQFLVIDSG